MAKFTVEDPEHPYYGFDPNAIPPWQMVPVGGTRSVYLDDGANMKVKLKDPATMNELSPSVASFNEVSSPGQYRREFQIFGYSPQRALLHAEDSSKSAKLKIRILSLKITYLDFYRLYDNQNHTKANQSEYPQLVKNVNLGYFFNRTNVWIQRKDEYQLTVDYDFGNVIDADTLIAELKSRFSWDGTYPSIILVWNFKKRGNEYPKKLSGFTKPPFIILRDPQNDTESQFRDKLLAHEIGHYFLGPDHHDSDNNLMGYGYVSGNSLLNRRQMVRFNENKTAWWE